MVLCSGAIPSGSGNARPGFALLLRGLAGVGQRGVGRADSASPVGVRENGPVFAHGGGRLVRHRWGGPFRALEEAKCRFAGVAESSIPQSAARGGAAQMASDRVEALIAKLQKGRLKTRQALSFGDDSAWGATVYEGSARWDVRSLLAHFVSAEQRLRELAQNVASGGHGIGSDFDFDAFNAEEQRRLQGETPAELLTKLDEAREATLRWVRTLEDRQLDQLGEHPVLGRVSVEAMVMAIYGHQLLHIRDLKSRIGLSQPT